MNAALALQAERIRAMTADDKVRITQSLWVETRAAIAAGVRARHPEWPDGRVAERVRELMCDAGA